MPRFFRTSNYQIAVIGESISCDNNVNTTITIRVGSSDWQSRDITLDIEGYIDWGMVNITEYSGVLNMIINGVNYDLNMRKDIPPYISYERNMGIVSTHLSTLHEHMHMSYNDENDYDNKMKKRVKYPKMKCVNCKDEIDSPENIDGFLGAQETKDYIKYCKSIKEKPQLFCCSCFDVASENTEFMNAHNKMKKMAELMSSNIKMQKELRKKEKELDREIRKYRKNNSKNTAKPRSLSGGKQGGYNPKMLLRIPEEHKGEEI